MIKFAKFFLPFVILIITACGDNELATKKDIEKLRNSQNNQNKQVSEDSKREKKNFIEDPVSITYKTTDSKETSTKKSYCKLIASEVWIYPVSSTYFSPIYGRGDACAKQGQSGISPVAYKNFDISEWLYNDSSSLISGETYKACFYFESEETTLKMSTNSNPDGGREVKISHYSEQLTFEYYTDVEKKYDLTLTATGGYGCSLKLIPNYNY